MGGFIVIKMFLMTLFDCVSTFNHDIKNIITLDLVQRKTSSPNNIFKSITEMVQYTFQKCCSG